MGLCVSGALLGIPSGFKAAAPPLTNGALKVASAVAPRGSVIRPGLGTARARLMGGSGVFTGAVTAAPPG